ncbi:MAG: hypothetical protein ABJJ53_06310 [Sulfitobacter sp.]
MRNFFAAVIAVAVLPAAVNAQSYQAVNRLNVIPLERSVFEVIQTRGEGPRGIWCAAAEYAERRLGATGRIYIQKPRGAAQRVKGRKSVTFTTDAGRLSQGPSQSISLSITQVGVGLPVAHAIQFCRRVDYEINS